MCRPPIQGIQTGIWGIRREPWGIRRGLWGIQRGVWGIQRGLWGIRRGSWGIQRGAWGAHAARYSEFAGDSEALPAEGGRMAPEQAAVEQAVGPADLHHRGPAGHAQQAAQYSQGVLSGQPTRDRGGQR
eukprot:756930-Prorocentrum_minimum.AAC.1